MLTARYSYTGATIFFPFVHQDKASQRFRATA